MGQKQRLRAERRRLGDQNLSVKVYATDNEDLDGVEVDLVEIDGAGNPPETPPDGSIEVNLTPPPADTAATDDDTEDGDADPLAELQRQYAEAKAARKAAEAEAKEKAAAEARYKAEAEQARAEREAVEAKWREEQKRRDELEVQNIQTQREQLVSHKAVLDGALERAEESRKQAQRVYAEAMMAGDFDRAGEAQAAISEAVFEKRRLTEGLERLDERIKAPVPEYTRAPEPERPQPQQSPADAWEAAIAGYGERDKAWLRQHRDDLMASAEKQQLAEAGHKTATLRFGLQPGTDEYYAYLDEHMGYTQPEENGSGQEIEPQPAPVQRATTPPAPRQASKRPTAAPASRSSSSSSTAKVFLTEWDREQARILGQTDKEYAQYKANAQNDQLTQAQAGGRLMARYSA